MRAPLPGESHPSFGRGPGRDKFRGRKTDGRKLAGRGGPLRGAGLLALFLLTLPSLLVSQELDPAPAQVASAVELRRIDFGSCIDASRPHPLLSTAAARDPDLFLFLGDNVYADARRPGTFDTAYRELAESSDFQRLTAAARTLAIWDDHDYGLNDSGAEYPLAEESEEAFLEFWEVPSWDPRRQRRGIYGFREYGPPERRVQIILLDTRRFRSALRRGNEAEAGRYEGPYRQIADPEATLLGEAQWRWLEKTLRRPAAVRIVASSIQVLAEHHGWESWANFPLEQERLFRLLIERGAVPGAPRAPAEAAGAYGAGASGASAPAGAAGTPEKVVFVSGDRHFAEMSRRNIELAGESLELLEVTSSGVNRGYPRALPLTENRYRVGEGIRANNFGELRLRWSEGGVPTIEATVLTAEDEIVLREQL